MPIDEPHRRPGPLRCILTRRERDEIIQEAVAEAMKAFHEEFRRLDEQVADRAARSAIEAAGASIVGRAATAIAQSKPDQIAGRRTEHQNLSKAQLRALQRASNEPRRIVISRHGTSATVADSLVSLGLWSKFFESYPNTARSLTRYAFTDAGIAALRIASRSTMGGDR